MSKTEPNRSSFTPTHGFVENIFVKVGKFTFLADFYIIDMDENRDIPILLGRGFLATCGALINVTKGELKTRVKNEEETFGIYKARKRENEKEWVFLLKTDEVKPLPLPSPPRTPPDKSTK